MAADDLTTLALVKEYLTITDSGSDPMLSRMVTGLSRSALRNLNRDSLTPRVYNETYNGPGGPILMLRKWPVLSVSSVAVSGVSISAATNWPTGAGYYADIWDQVPPGGPQKLTLNGYAFVRGFQNVSVSYMAGYGVLNEAQTIPSSAPYALAALAPMGIMSKDLGVTYADGTPLVAVTGTPSEGQYVPPTPLEPQNKSTAYTFASADAGEPILLSYGYIPFDVERAVCELIGNRYKYREHIGVASKSLGGQETISFERNDYPAWFDAAMTSYRNVVPPMG